MLSSSRGVSLRSRCSLRPTAARSWELLDGPGRASETFSMDSAGAIALLNDAIATAKDAGVSWMTDKLTLKPAGELVDLVRESQARMASEDETEAS